MNVKSDIWLKRIWFVNGIILFLFFLLGILFVSNEIIYQFDRNRSDERGVIVGEEKNDAESENLELQTIRLSTPQDIFNSDIKFISVYQKDYDTPRKVLEISGSAKYLPEGMKINVIFTDQSKKYTKLLLDRKASINKMNYPSYEQEKQQKFIYYEISFEDTDNNGRINSEDKNEYYISNFDGTDFRRILPLCYQVEEYDFSDDYSKLYFICKIEPNDNNISPEYWEKILVEYDFSKDEIIVDESLNSLVNKARKIIVK